MMKSSGWRSSSETTCGCYSISTVWSKNGKPPSRRAIYRFFRDTGAAGVDVCLLALADLRATYEQTLPQETWAAALEIVREFLENWYEKPAETIAPPPLVDGNVLMSELALPAGKTDRRCYWMPSAKPRRWGK